MASPYESSHRGVRRHEDRLGARSRPNDPGPEHQYPALWEFCVLCFLTLGSREKKVHWGEGFAHPSCVAKLRKPEAA